MSVKDFYNAVTPGSSLGHGVGRGVYKLIDTKEICSQKMLDEENLPKQSRHEISVLNEVQTISNTNLVSSCNSKLITVLNVNNRDELRHL